VSAYIRYREEMAERTAADRRAFVLALADRGAPSARELAQALGVAADHEHLALVCWAEPGVVLDGISVERWVDRVAHRLGCSGRTVVAIDDTVTVVWLTSRSPFTGRQRDPAAGIDQVGVARVAVGVPASGPAGLRRTLVAARDAQRFAARGGRPQRLIHYEDIALPALLGEDPERARWFIQEALGDLAAEDGATSVLRRTVRVHLDTNGSLVRTAAGLHVHRNTVVQRLARAEAARGALLTERALELHVAVALADDHLGDVATTA
jgi:sugar diacid utilization regulator